jgi:hypothetical protein
MFCAAIVAANVFAHLSVRALCCIVMWIMPTASAPVVNHVAALLVAALLVAAWPVVVHPCDVLPVVAHCSAALHVAVQSAVALPAAIMHSVATLLCRMLFCACCWESGCCIAAAAMFIMCHRRAKLFMFLM